MFRSINEYLIYGCVSWVAVLMHRDVWLWLPKGLSGQVLRDWATQFFDHSFISLSLSHVCYVCWKIEVNCMIHSAMTEWNISTFIQQRKIVGSIFSFQKICGMIRDYFTCFYKFHTGYCNVLSSGVPKNTLKLAYGSNALRNLSK